MKHDLLMIGMYGLYSYSLYCFARCNDWGLVWIEPVSAVVSLIPTSMIVTSDSETRSIVDCSNKTTILNMSSLITTE